MVEFTKAVNIILFNNISGWLSPQSALPPVYAHVNNDQSTQATLPVKLGGLRFQRAVALTPSA